MGVVGERPRPPAYLELFEYLARPGQYRGRQAREAGDLDAVRAAGYAPRDAPEEEG